MRLRTQNFRFQMLGGVIPPMRVPVMLTFRSLRAQMALTLLLATTIPVPAQQAVGNITGTITDPQSAVVQSATVEVRNVHTNTVFKTATNENGTYNAPNLAV